MNTPWASQPEPGRSPWANPPPSPVAPAASATRPSLLFAAIVAAAGAFGWLTWSAPNLLDRRWAVFGFVACMWVVSLCIHEFAHAVVAFLGGDRSVVAKGYLTLDPRRYTEPVLSIVMPLVFLMLGGIGLPGGAVWINRGAIRSPIMQSLMSLAGPAASVGVGIVLGVPFILFPDTVLEHGAFASALAFLVALQFTSAALNLLPVPGLDGYGVIEPHLPADVRASLDRLRPVAFIMLFVLLWNVPQAWRVIWGPATRAMEAMQVPNGLAGLGLELFRFWR